MAVNAAVVYQIQADGNDANGGGYKTGASGTDYSQQAAAQKSGADLTMHASTNTKVSPVAAKVAAADVGNLVHISAGTNWTTGWYEITAQDGGDPGYWTLDRSPAAASEANLGTYKMGGALASIGGLGEVLTTAGGGGGVSGLCAYMKGGTYNLSGTTVNTAGGPLDLDETAQDSLAFTLKGYDAGSARTAWTGTRPIIDCNDQAPTNVIELKGASNEPHIVAFLDILGDSGTSRAINGVIGNTFSYDRVYDCIVRDCDGSSAYNLVTAVRCLAYSCAANGFASCSTWGCLADTCEVGFAGTYLAASCVARCGTGSSNGFTFSGGLLINCVSYDNGGDGFECNIDRSCTYINCVAWGNGAYGYDTGPEAVLYNCASGDNASGRLPGTVLLDSGVIPITVDPFVDPNNAGRDYDWSLNWNAAGGALLRATGFSALGQTGYPDVGAVQSLPDFPAVGNVTEDDAVNNATGTYHEATEAEVQSGVTFGAGSALTGTYAGGGAGGGPIFGGMVVR